MSLSSSPTVCFDHVIETNVDSVHDHLSYQYDYMDDSRYNSTFENAAFETTVEGSKSLASISTAAARETEISATTARWYL